MQKKFDNIFHNFQICIHGLRLDWFHQMLKKQFETFFDPKSSLSYSYQYQSDLAFQKKKIQEYAHYTSESVKETILSYLNPIEKRIDERACHEEELRIIEKDVKDKQAKLEMKKQEIVIQKSECSSSGDNLNAKIEKQEMKENCNKIFQELKKVVFVLNPRGLFTNENGLAFEVLFGEDYDSFAYKFYHNLARLENQMSHVKFHECDSKTYLIEPRKQCEAFFTNKNPKSLDFSMFSYYLEVFQKYTLHDIKSTKDMLVRYLNAIEKEIDARAHHEGELARVYDSRVNEKTMQTQAGMVYMVKDKCDDGLVVKAKRGTESHMRDECSKSRNDTQAEGPDIRLSNDTKPLHEVQSTVAYNVNANDRQHAEQTKFINEGKVDQDAEQCLENKSTELNQNLVSKNDFQRSNVESNQCDEVKVKVNFDEIETNNIELEHRVSSLIKENEHLKLLITFLEKKIPLQAQLMNLKRNRGENICDNAKCEFQTKFVELKKVLTQQTKDFDDVKLELSNRTAKFEAYFEKLEKMKVVLERQLARKVDDSKAEKDRFLKEIHHLRTQLENMKGKRVETKLDNSSILGKPLLLNNERDQLLKQIAFLESKLASQDIRSCQKEYHELRTSYNALKVKFDSLNRKKWKTNVSKSSKPKESVSEKSCGMNWGKSTQEDTFMYNNINNISAFQNQEHRHIHSFISHTQSSNIHFRNSDKSRWIHGKELPQIIKLLFKTKALHEEDCKLSIKYEYVGQKLQMINQDGFMVKNFLKSSSCCSRQKLYMRKIVSCQ
ncbi:hypothetical protein Tco_0568700 [Tanacetum coccineum]